MFLKYLILYLIQKGVDLLKRTFDLVATFFVLLLLLPVLMLIALMVRSKLGSPIFFKQYQDFKKFYE